MSSCFEGTLIGGYLQVPQRQQSTRQKSMAVVRDMSRQQAAIATGEPQLEFGAAACLPSS